MTGRDPTTVLLDVQDRLEADFQATGWQSFSLDRLVAAGLGTEEEIAGALMRLRSSGLVEVHALIRCANHHHVHGCAPEEVGQNLKRRCPKAGCGESCRVDDVEFLFRISDAWAARLRRIADKKKDLHPQHP